MSEAKHTPTWSYAAPWSWDGCYPIRVVDSAGYIVCDGIMPGRARDACLIAAAPALYEALKLCAAVCAGETMNKNGLINALEKARAALSLAEGKEQA